MEDNKSFRFIDLDNGGQTPPPHPLPNPRIKVNSIDEAKVDTPKHNIDLETERPKPMAEREVLKSANKGAIKIKDLNLSFSTPKDYYFIDDLIKKHGKDVLNHPVIKRMIISGYLKKALCSEALAEIKKWEEENKKRQEREKRQRDGIIVDKYKPGNDPDGPIEIDVSDGKRFSGGTPNESSMPW